MAHRVVSRLRERLLSAARTAIGAVEGGGLVEAALRAEGRVDAPVRVWAVGKAATAMARGAARALSPRVTGGLILTKAGALDSPPGLVVYEAAHPVPDERGARATDALLAEAGRLTPEDRVLLLLSGGASALLCRPVAGLDLRALTAASATLIRSGASIQEINCVRRRLGVALGGRLAAATPAPILALALSDVIGDDPATIGSGPVSPDPTSAAHAVTIARRRHLSADVIAALGRSVDVPAQTFARVRYRVIASPERLLKEAIAAVAAIGLRPLPTEARLEGDVAEVAAALLAQPPGPGEVVVAVGEPTVTVRGDGLGGRAQHLALLMARAIAGRPLAFLACGSDGSDGPTPSAGAVVDGETAKEARHHGLDLDGTLASFDSHPLLQRLGRTVDTGPTGTNLTDLVLFAGEFAQDHAGDNV
jgi:glycerate-2-kinase